MVLEQKQSKNIFAAEFEQFARGKSEQPAIIDVRSGKTLTYGEFFDLTSAWAGLLTAELDKGCDCVMSMLADMSKRPF